MTDTARADRFSYTGRPGPGTPNVDALAEEGAGFTNAISPVIQALHSAVGIGDLESVRIARNPVGALDDDAAVGDMVVQLSRDHFDDTQIVSIAELLERFKIV